LAGNILVAMICKGFQMKSLGSCISLEMLKNPLFRNCMHAAPNGTIFCMDHPQVKEIQVCSNKVPGVINGHVLLRGRNFL